MTVVPAEWTRMVGTLRDAQIARDCMKAFEASQTDIDLATFRYTLSANGGLGRITLLLSKKERS